MSRHRASRSDAAPLLRAAGCSRIVSSHQHVSGTKIETLTLSLLCRLVDDEPDLLSERERTRVMHKAGSRARPHKEVHKHLKRRFDGAAALRRTAVIDHHGAWMAQWRRDFGALGIDFKDLSFALSLALGVEISATDLAKHRCQTLLGRTSTRSLFALPLERESRELKLDCLL